MIWRNPYFLNFLSLPNISVVDWPTMNALAWNIGMYSRTRHITARRRERFNHVQSLFSSYVVSFLYIALTPCMFAEFSSACETGRHT
jgi:hypothetical protein